MHVDEPAQSLCRVAVSLKPIFSIYLIVLLCPLVARGDTLILSRNTRHSDRVGVEEKDRVYVVIFQLDLVLYCMALKYTAIAGTLLPASCTPLVP